MRILEYTGLDTARVAAQYRRATEAIAREDFRAAEVKKLVNLGHGKFYRARLDGANRLLFALVRHSGQTCALMLEVIMDDHLSADPGSSCERLMASRWGRRSNATPAADRCPTGRAVNTLHTMKYSS